MKKTYILFLTLSVVVIMIHTSCKKQNTDLPFDLKQTNTYSSEVTIKWLELQWHIFINQRIYSASIISVNNTIYVAGGTNSLSTSYFKGAWKLEF